MPIPIESSIQQLDLPNLVELFDISYAGVHYYVTNSLIADGIYWNGVLYSSFPLNITGLAYNETNSSESPKLQVSNVGNHFQTVFSLIPNMKGAFIVYVRTFETYTGLTAINSSSLAIFKRYLTVDKLLSKTSSHLVYELGTLTAFKEKLFPRRQMLRDGRPKMRFEGLGINKQR